MAQNKEDKLARSTIAQLLSVNRTSLYYKASEPSELELAANNLIYILHTNHPAWGSRQLSKQLKAARIPVGRLKTRRYMSKMGIEAIYLKPNLSKAVKNHLVFPYLLRNFTATRPNQIWSIDIIYIHMKHGFMYLTAIIDWYS